MPEETPPSAPAESPETATADVAPEKFPDYVKWRTTGVSAPESQPEAPAAAEETPQAKTAPDSETEKDQEPEEEDTDDDESEEEPAGPKRPGSRQRRIDRLTRENEEFKRRLAEIEQRDKPPPKEKAAAAEGEPQLEQFETLQDYQRALAEYFFEQAREKDRKAAAVAKVQEAWDGKEKAARKAHSDYDDVIDSFKVPEGPGVMAARHAMLEDPHGAEILYYLGKRQKDVQRIAALDPINAVREIGRLSAMFDSSASTPETAKRITSAPRLLPPVGRPAKITSDSIYDEEVAKDYPRWEKARQAQLRNS
jgi:hypothetical protein